MQRWCGAKTFVYRIHLNRSLSDSWKTKNKHNKQISKQKDLKITRASQQSGARKKTNILGQSLKKRSAGVISDVVWSDFVAILVATCVYPQSPPPPTNICATEVKKKKRQE